MSLLLLALLCVQDEKPEELKVEVLEVRGSVERKIPKQKEWAEVTQGTSLTRGTMIQTGVKSSALLQLGKSTKILVRSSTFAVINESFVKKNTVTGEIRLDVGSVYIDADKDRDEDLDVKVKTPQGTAAVRGTKLAVGSTSVGMRAIGDEGVASVRTIYGWDYRVGQHLRSLHSAVSGDLARMARSGRRTHFAQDNLARLEALQGDQSWAVKAFNPSSETDKEGQRLPSQMLTTPRTLVASSSGPVNAQTWKVGFGFATWEMDWSSDGSSIETMSIRSPSLLTTATMVSSNFWEFRIHGRLVWMFDGGGSTPQIPDWTLIDPYDNRLWNFAFSGWQWTGPGSAPPPLD